MAAADHLMTLFLKSESLPSPASSSSDCADQRDGSAEYIGADVGTRRAWHCGRGKGRANLRLLRIAFCKNAYWQLQCTVVHESAARSLTYVIVQALLARWCALTLRVPEGLNDAPHLLLGPRATQQTRGSTSLAARTHA